MTSARGLTDASPLRVLHLGAGNLYGGVERSLTTLARSRDLTPGMVPRFALAFGDGPVAGQLAATGTPPAVVYGPVRAGRPWTVWRARRRLAEFLRAERPDVVVAHAPWTLAVVAPAVRAAGVPLVFWMHDAADGRHWTERWARRHPPDLVIANSRWTAGGLPALFGPRRAATIPTTVLPYPVPAPSPADPAARAATRAELGVIGPDDVVIVQVSRMEPWKGQRAHLLALGLLRNVPRWTCWLVGGAQRPSEAAYLAKLRAFAVRLGVADRVRFLGQRDDVERLLTAADVFCQPNTGPEPFGIVFVEALGAGLPVVATNAGGVVEIVDDTCGRLVAPDDPESLANILRELVTDPVLREALARRGPARARALCDPTGVLRRLETALRALVA